MTHLAPSTPMPGVLQWNCRGLSGKVGEINQRIRLGRLSTWALLLLEHNSLIRIYGFTEYATPSIPDRRCVASSVTPGKAAVYVDTRYPQAPISLTKWCTQWQEVVAVLVRLPHTDVILVSCYVRPYSGRVVRIRLGWIRHLRQAHPGCPVLVAGDFNAPHMAWGYSYSSTRGQMVMDTFIDAQFVLLNAPSAPTRRGSRQHASPSSPDLAWWLGHTPISWEREPDCWGSDHYPIYLGLRPGRTRRLRRQCRVTNWNMFRSLLNASLLSGIHEPPGDPLTLIRAVIFETTQCTWVDESRPVPDLHLLCLWDERGCAEAALSRDPHSITARCDLHRLTALARRHEKRLSRSRWLEWCASLGPSSNTASVWRTYCAMEKGARPPDPASSACLASGKDSPQFAPEVARSFFPDFDCAPPPFTRSSTLPTHVGGIPTNSDLDGIQAPITMAELLAAIDQASTRSAPGPDGIRYEVYKNMEGPALQWLLDILNTVWISGEVPTTWKHAEIVPIPKPGKPAGLLTNLRPIALTSTLCKLLERMVATRLSWWLEQFGWYNPSQIGFRPHLGTEDGLHHLSSAVLIGGRSHRVRTLLAMDIHRAYDNVSHEAILCILQWLRLPDSLCSFVRSFLQHRSFSVRLGGSSFGHFKSVRGVPQGSVLAPLLFNVALLPLAWKLSEIPDIHFLIYADDVTVWTTHLSLERQKQGLQTALDATLDWCTSVGLTLSSEKTAYLSIASSWGRRKLRQTPIRLTLAGSDLIEKSTLRVLGVEFSATGSASPWLCNARKSASSMLHLIRRIAQRSGGGPALVSPGRWFVQYSNLALSTRPSFSVSPRPNGPVWKPLIGKPCESLRASLD